MVPPDYFWPAGFIAYTIPLIILFNFFLLIAKIRSIQFSALYPIIILIIGIGYVRDTFSLNLTQDEGDITIISYNTKVFNIYENDGNDTKSVTSMINWANEQYADIICMQEFYNNGKSSVFNTLNKISKAHSYYYYHVPVVTNTKGAEFGTVIFSRYPIIDTGVVPFSESTKNNVIYTDLNLGNDTLRIYNMHLQSMHINENDVVNTEDLATGLNHVFPRLKSGFISRAGQIRSLKKHLSECPYPIVLCGDLNDLPYSYAYQELENDLSNGFKQAGSGFGFTYNGKLFFLRIDNHFFSDELEINSFQTHREMKKSDHFPISATYTIKK